MAAISEIRIRRADQYVRWDIGTTEATVLHGYGEPKEGKFTTGIIPRGRDAGTSHIAEYPVLNLVFKPAYPQSPKEVDTMLDMSPEERRLAYGSHTVWTSAADPRHQAGEYLVGVDQPTLPDLGLVEPDINLAIAAGDYLSLPPKVRDGIRGRYPIPLQPIGVSKEEAEQMRILLQAGVESMPGATDIVDAIDKWVDDKVQQALDDLKEAAKHPWQTTKWLVDRYVDTPAWVERPKAPWRK